MSWGEENRALAPSWWPKVSLGRVGMGGDLGFPTVTNHPWDSPGVLFQQLT